MLRNLEETFDQLFGSLRELRDEPVLNASLEKISLHEGQPTLIFGLFRGYQSVGHNSNGLAGEPEHIIDEVGPRVRNLPHT